MEETLEVSLLCCKVMYEYKAGFHILELYRKTADGDYVCLNGVVKEDKEEAFSAAEYLWDVKIPRDKVKPVS